VRRPDGDFRRSDTTPPVLSNGAPSGTLASGTTQANLTLTTDETATCKYATSSGVVYASMTHTFTTTNSTSHSTPVSGLSDGTTYPLLCPLPGHREQPGLERLSNHFLRLQIRLPAARRRRFPMFSSGTLPTGTTGANLQVHD